MNFLYFPGNNLPSIPKSPPDSLGVGLGFTVVSIKDPLKELEDAPSVVDSAAPKVAATTKKNIRKIHFMF